MVFSPFCQRKGARSSPLPLVCKFVILGAESRQTDAVAIAPFGYDVELIKLRFLILSHNRNFLEVIEL